jgi:phage shock protein PspC (stress-responsive transcriptional regulator)/anti-sigma regulatory factor (Ser/Thr protein kinase)
MTAPNPTAPRLLRDPANRVVGGVAAGLARHLGVPVMAVRIAFFVLALADGLGAILYAVFWAILPVSAEGGRRNVRQMVPFVALGVGVGIVHILLSGAPSASTLLGWLAAMVALGAGIIWHQAGPRRRQRWTHAMPALPWLGVLLDSDRRGVVTRFLGGGLLMVVGVIGIFSYLSPLSSDGFADMLNGLVLAAVGLAGVGIALAPVVWRMFTQLRHEREGRIREQERAELAAMIHDQVLHTLTLIQRNPGDTKTVLRLARGQERTLRNWLYKPTASPTERFSAAIEQAAAEVEDTYAVAVETVVVGGDRPVDERIEALVAAAREALVNAARHAKVTTVSLYAEVEDEQISVFVRDRGVGFDLSTVDDKRHGVRGSILGRMDRHGGRAEIRSNPGDGTEVQLTMPQGDLRRSGAGEWLGVEPPRSDGRAEVRADGRAEVRADGRAELRADGRAEVRAEVRQAER